MKETLDNYIRRRANELGLSRTDIADRAQISRQTLYSLTQIPQRLPDLKTIVSLADVLHVHPLRLLNLVFDDVPMATPVVNAHKRGDHSAFVQDVTCADGSLVLVGQRFSKTWELQNVGKVIWENRFLRCVDEEVMIYTRSGETLLVANSLVPDKTQVPVPYTKPGDKVQVTVEFTAPNQPCTVMSYWKTVFEDGTHCFPKSVGTWVQVRVMAVAASAHALR